MNIQSPIPTSFYARVYPRTQALSGWRKKRAWYLLFRHVLLLNMRSSNCGRGTC